MGADHYHYPLLDYAFRALSRGDLPEWDPTQYCGLSFVGNVQAALFYPPNWLLFASNIGRRRLAFQSLEALVVAHFWLAFLLCYCWLRGRRMTVLAGALGAAVYAFSGYMVSQVQHVGVVTGYAWFPLGLRGIDQAGDSRDWSPLWKTVVASAMCFLAGYPPTWFVFCACAMLYAATAARGPRLFWATGLSLASSLLAVMIQLAPALEAASVKVRELKYEGGVHRGAFYLSYLLPNYFDVGRPSIGEVDPTRQYFYLGAPALFGLAWLARRRSLPGQRQFLAVAAVSLAVFTNPFGSVGALASCFYLLGELCRGWNFLAGLSLAATLLTAAAIDDFLKRESRHKAGWLAPAVAAFLLAWSVRQWLVWLPGGADFASGWRVVFEPLTTLAAFSLGLFLWRAEAGARRALLGVALLGVVAADYKVFGTSKRFNAVDGDVDQLYTATHFPEMDPAVYRQLSSQPAFRVAVGLAPHPTELRLFGLPTPQGSDPMLPAHYQETVAARALFRTDRLFDVDPTNEVLLQLLAVRYFMTNRTDALHPTLSSNKMFRLLEPSHTYFQVFEYLRAKPAYRWESGEGSVQCTLWAPEVREFAVQSSAGGRFLLVEQFFPGWQATVDGQPAEIERWSGAFQAVSLPAGEHHIRFQFRSRGLRIGAMVTVVYLLGAWWMLRKRRRWQ